LRQKKDVCPFLLGPPMLGRVTAEEGPAHTAADEVISAGLRVVHEMLAGEGHG